MQSSYKKVVKANIQSNNTYFFPVFRCNGLISVCFKREKTSSHGAVVYECGPLKIIGIPKFLYTLIAPSDTLYGALSCSTTVFALQFGLS